MKKSPPPKTQIIIRPMRRKDVGVVVGMINRLNLFHRDEGVSKSSFLLKHCFGPKTSVKVWLALVDQKPVGFALTYEWINFVQSARDCSLDLLFVEKEWRSKGVGQALITRAAAAALHSGCARLLTSSATENARAKNFYLQLGFTLRTKNPYRYMMQDKALRALIKHKS